MRRIVLTALFLLAGLPSAIGEEVGAPETGVKTLASRLTNLESGRLLEVYPTGTPPLRGFTVAVLRDTLFLRHQEGDSVFALALDRIELVRVWRKNTKAGARIGAVSGVVIAGAFGALVGAYLTSIDGHDNGVVGGALAGFTLFGAAGAAGGGLLGAGIGSVSSSWHSLWPEAAQSPSPATVRPAPSGATRLGLFAGAARSLLEGYEVTRLAARLSLRRDVGEKLSLGPEIGFESFGGSTTRQGENSTYQSGVDDIVKFSLTGNLRSRRTGPSPHLTAGAGWFISNDAYLGAHVGGGVQWRGQKGHDVGLDIRYNFGLREVDASQVATYWTVGLSFGFGL